MPSVTGFRFALLKGPLDIIVRKVANIKAKHSSGGDSLDYALWNMGI